MLYTISTSGPQVILTVTPDLSINTTNLNRTDLLLEHAVSSSFSAVVFDLESMSTLSSIGCWVIFQVAYKARERGKRVFLYNIPSSIQSVLNEAGIFNLASAIHTKAELESALQEIRSSMMSTGPMPPVDTLSRMGGVPQGGRATPAGTLSSSDSGTNVFG